MVPPADLEAIKSRFSKPVYMTLEVTLGGASDPAQYLGLGSINVRALA